MKTARERFQEGPHRAEWENIVAGEAFQDAVHSASVQMLHSLILDENHAESAHWKIDGVLQFVEVLSTLHELPKLPTPEPRPPELDYSVGKPKR